MGMKYVVPYLIGAILGFLLWRKRKRQSERDEENVNNDCKPNLVIDYGSSSRNFENNHKVYIVGNKCHKLEKPRPITGLIIPIITIIILILITNDEHNSWSIIKTVIEDMVKIASPIVTFALGLCTPYLTDRTTKILNKARKERKKKCKRKKHEDKKKKKK